MEVPFSRPHFGHLESDHKYKLTTKNVSYKLSSCYNEFIWLPIKEATQTKCILKNVTCEAEPGELTAIAGPSGAGKTTLLEILAGTIIPGRISGNILVNNLPMNVSHFRKVSGYVTQDETLFPLLTVQETLSYSARLRLNAPREKADARVQKLLKELGLEHVASTRVGSESTRGISGGEKRRLSIGAELVHDPPVLLLDEPTSGLDSASALHVMSLLKSMAQNQCKTIIVTIHQPGFRILDLIDKVVLLSNGVVLHNGSLLHLQERLQFAGHVIPCHVNVLEFAIDATESLHTNKQTEPYIVIKCETGQISNQKQGRKQSLSYCNSPLHEVIILSQRFSKNIFRTKQLFAAKTIQSLLAGIVLGTIFINAFGKSDNKKVQNQVGFFAFTLTFLISSTTEALPIFLQERRILMKETSIQAYRISSYIIANFLIFLPFLLLVSVLYTSPVYYLIGLRKNADGFLYFTLVVWITALTTNSFVACFSALVPDYITGMSVIYGVTGSFFLFSGYFLSRDSIPKWCRFMQYLSLFKYPFECFMINEFGGEKGKVKCLESVGGECLIYGNEFLVQQGLKESQKWNNLFMMLSFMIGYRLLGFMFLWYRCYRTRC